MNDNFIELTPANSGAMCSIAVEKDGPLSLFLGHNLILRVTNFVLRAAPTVPSISMLLQEAQEHNWGWSRDDAILAQCCHAVAGATMKTKSITVHGACSSVFTKPSAINAAYDAEFMANRARSAADSSSSSSSLSDAATKIAAEENKRVGGHVRTFPALFRWPCWEMSESDVFQIEQNVWGVRGRLGCRQDFTTTMHDIDFKRDWSSADWIHAMDGIRNKPPFHISGGLSINSRRLPLQCSAFLTSSSLAYGGGPPQMVAMKARAARTHTSNPDQDEPAASSGLDIVVFQCPIRSSRWNVEPVSQFGMLKTKDDVLVEVALPVKSLLGNYPQ